MYKTEAHTKVEGNVLAAYLAVLIIRIVEDEATGQERLVQEVGEDGLQDMQLLLENFGLLYKAMLETLEDQVVHSSKEDATASPSKKEDTNDDRIRQTYQSIRNTIQILRNIQCSRVRVG
ncbi:hypothetical protein DFQ26_004059 [Actinomortierella ambigua]|nr:hypothetical protein DFQ26_004059 [Actinomortierella ambigua]